MIAAVVLAAGAATRFGSPKQRILLEPVLSSFWAWLAHGEQPGAWSLTGCAVILGSTLVYTLARR